jgi:AcrR family transcriptional regulator
MSTNAMTGVLDALAIIEQFELLLQNLKSFSQELSSSHRLELNVHIETLKSLIEILDTSDTPFVNLKDSKPDGFRSIVERLKIAGELIRLRGEPGTKTKDLAEMFGISEGTIIRFFRYYDSCKPSQQIKYQRISIFDTTQQLEQLAVTIQRNMARLEGHNDDVNVKYVAEMRQVIIAAAQLAEKMSNYEQYVQFKAAVESILLEELPHKRTEILNKIGKARTNTVLGTRQAEQIQPQAIDQLPSSD